MRKNVFESYLENVLFSPRINAFVTSIFIVNICQTTLKCKRTKNPELRNQSRDLKEYKSLLTHYWVQTFLAVLKDTRFPKNKFSSVDLPSDFKNSNNDIKIRKINHHTIGILLNNIYNFRIFFRKFALTIFVGIIQYLDYKPYCHLKSYSK